MSGNLFLEYMIPDQAALEIDYRASTPAAP